MIDVHELVVFDFVLARKSFARAMYMLLCNNSVQSVDGFEFADESCGCYCLSCLEWRAWGGVEFVECEAQMILIRRGN